MKIINTIILFISFTLSIGAQTSIKKIDIYYFDNLGKEYEQLVNDIWEKLDKQKNKFKFELKLINFYDPSKALIVRDTSSIKYMLKDIDNSNYFQEDAVSQKLNELSAEFDYKAVVTLSGNYNFVLQNGLFENEKELKKLKKNITRKNRNEKVFILLNNGFQKCKYCEQNLPFLMEELSRQGELSSLQPKLTVPEKNGQTIRPIGQPSRYYIEFEQEIDLFSNYEIEITSSSLSEPLLKKVIPFTEMDNSSENIQMIRTSDGKIRIFIRDEFLGIECLKLQESANSDDINLECDCIYECLYRKVFKLRIRGVSQGSFSHDLWSKQIDVFFQCSK
jgi:hypothetical protein